MESQYSLPDGNSANIPIITLLDPMTGLPCQVLRPAYEHALRTGEPIVIRLKPHLAEDRPRPDSARTPEDDIIAEILDDHPGISRPEIERIASSDYSKLGAGCVKRRMADAAPLRLEGYHTTGSGKATRYWPPST